MLFASTAFCQDPQEIFSFDENGEIITNEIFIDSLEAGNYQNITPYIPVDSFVVPASDTQSYTIALFRYNGWQTEAGDMDVIEVKS